ncbi:MAG: stage sporulation protein [Candidatus Petromonas sp.]|nr:stage sporulation protein [Candidatus Petromonas sp.]
MNKRLNEVIIKHVEGNLLTYFFVIMFFMVGISSGAFTTKALSQAENKELIKYLQNFFRIVDTKVIDQFSILKQALINNLQTGVLIWILGVTIIGIPLILLLVAVRGFIIGFTVGFFIQQMGVKGLIFSILSLLPQNIIIIPGVIIVAVLGISFSIMLIRNKVKKTRYDNVLNQFFVYSTVIAIVHIFIAVGCLVEAYISPLFIKYMSSYM